MDYEKSARFSRMLKQQLRLFAACVVVSLMLCVYIFWSVTQTKAIRKTYFSWTRKQSIREYQECQSENYILGQHADQDDPCLVEAFRKKMLIPPPPIELRIPLPDKSSSELPTNREKFQWVKQLLVERLGVKRGFFVELGANDGSFISPTAQVERDLGWTGLLIEAMPMPFKVLLSRRRNVWAVNAAACVNPYPEQVSIYYNPKSFEVSGFKPQTQFGVSPNKTMIVQCIPLYTMLKAVGKLDVDYLSLDVEGFELSILKTLPWDKISFKMMTIEHKWIAGGFAVLKEYLERKGYRFVKKLRDSYTEDSLFVKDSLYDDAIAVNKTMFKSV